MKSRGAYRHLTTRLLLQYSAMAFLLLPCDMAEVTCDMPWKPVLLLVAWALLLKQNANNVFHKIGTYESEMDILPTTQTWEPLQPYNVLNCQTGDVINTGAGICSYFMQEGPGYMRILQVPCSYFKSPHGLLTPTFIAGLERLFNLGSAHFPALYVSFLGIFFEIGHPSFSFFPTFFWDRTRFCCVSRASRSRISRFKGHIPPRSEIGQRWSPISKKEKN